MIKLRGFTLIELVIVIIILGILSAIALPRYIDFSSKAQSTSVQATSEALSSALSVAYSKWMAMGQPETTASVLNGITIHNGSSAEIGFNASGWPIAASSGALVTGDVLRDGVGINDHNICAQIMTNLFWTTSISVGGFTGCGKDYCAFSSASFTRCYYKYQLDTTQVITYDWTTGKIS